jgi:hypothetical protein
MRARTVGSLAAVMLALSVPNFVQAGFGRRGSASSHNDNNGGHHDSGRSSASRSDVHVDFRHDRPRSEPSREHRSRSSYERDGSPAPLGWGPNYHVWGYSFGYPPPPPPAADETWIVDTSAPTTGIYDQPGPRIATSLAGELTFGGHGFMLGTQLAWEGERLGFLLGYTAAFAPIAYTPDYDTIHLPLAHLTYALLSGERGRLRVEAGLHAAVAPEVTFVAPGLGFSGVLGLIGPLGLEARVFGNFWPYTQIDARGGLALNAGVLGVSFGMRALYLNDQGVLGAVNAGDTSDSFYGPYVNLGVAL